MNPNIRLGVLLRIYGASVRLSNILWRFRLKGLKRFEKEWPEPKRRKKLFGWGDKTSAEWSALLIRRQLKLKNDRIEYTVRYHIKRGYC